MEGMRVNGVKVTLTGNEEEEKWLINYFYAATHDRGENHGNFLLLFFCG